MPPAFTHIALHVRDLRLPEGLRCVAEPGQTVVTVVAPTMEEVTPTAAAVAAEPTPGEAPPAEAAPPKMNINAQL